MRAVFALLASLMPLLPRGLMPWCGWFCGRPLAGSIYSCTLMPLFPQALIPSYLMASHPHALVPHALMASRPHTLTEPRGDCETDGCAGAEAFSDGCDRRTRGGLMCFDTTEPMRGPTGGGSRGGSRGGGYCNLSSELRSRTRKGPALGGGLIQIQGTISSLSLRGEGIAGGRRSGPGLRRSRGRARGGSRGALAVASGRRSQGWALSVPAADSCSAHEGGERAAEVEEMEMLVGGQGAPPAAVLLASDAGPRPRPRMKDRLRAAHRADSRQRRALARRPGGP